MSLNFDSGKLKNIFWFGVATIIFALLVRLADLNEIINALREAELVYLVFSCVAGFSILVVWSLNWFTFFKVSKIGCSFGRTFQLFSAGQFLNSVTPLGQFGGQPFMAYMISKNSEASYEKSLATVMSADVIAVIPLSTFVILGYSYITFTGTVSSELTRMSIIASSLLLFGIVMSYLGWYRPGSLEGGLLKATKEITNIIGRGSSIVGKLETKLENVQKTFSKVGENPKAVIYSLIIAHTAFLLKMTVFYGVMLSLSLEMNVFQVMLLIPLASVANFSPTPGGAGTFEAAMAGLIILFVDVSFASALTAAILYRVATYWVNIVVGYISMSSLNYNLSHVKNLPES